MQGDIPAFWGTMGSPYGDAYRNSWRFAQDWPGHVAPPPAYSPYAGMGDFAGNSMLAPGIAPPLPPMPPQTMPGFAVGKAQLASSLGEARRTAKQGRLEAGATHGQNIANIGANTAERGIAFSGAHDILNTREADAYAKQLSSIAQALAAAQTGYSQGLMGLQAQNADFRSKQGTPFYPGGGNLGASMQAILATIRGRESGGNYSAENPTSTASGAYQFTDPTWRGLLSQFHLQGPAHAAYAGQQLQDVVARDYAQSILGAHGGNVSFIPQIWHWGGGGYDQHPWDAYDQAWLQLYRSLYGGQGQGGGGSNRRYS